MRLLYFFISILFLSACGEGGSSSDNKISSPQSEILQLNNHSVNDIFKLADDSLWLIVGLSTDSGVISEGEKNIIIYDNPDDFGEPDQGIRGQYYVFINNSADSFYIDPLPSPPILQEGNIELARLSLESIAVLDDNSVWKVKGLDDWPFSASNVFDYTLYDVNEDFPDLTLQTTGDFGELTSWYLYNEDAPFGYYLEPIVAADVVWEGEHSFFSEGINDSILLSDGSLWLITGAVYSATNMSGDYTIKLINNIDLLAEPTTGFKTGTIMYIQGHEAAFYVQEI